MKLWILAGLLSLLLAVFALYAPLTRRDYHIKLQATLCPKLKQPITIALLSDLHSGRFYQDSIIQALQEREVDLIALSGDMIDDEEDMQGAWEFFAKLDSSLETKLSKPLASIPKFYVSGNHEFWSGEIAAIKQKLASYNISVLDFSHPCARLRIKGLDMAIFGVDDPYYSTYSKPNSHIDKAVWDKAKWQGGFWEQEWQELVASTIAANQCPSLESTFTKVDSSKRACQHDPTPTAQNAMPNPTPSINAQKVDSSTEPMATNQAQKVDSRETDSRADFSLLLSHRPEFTKLFSSLPINLILSGHTHGGQVRIPYLLNGLYAPNQGLFPKYAGGLYELDSSKRQYLVISRGLSLNYRLPRVFNPPEIVFITLECG
ncbi:metallophosphoesterase [Helicobacter canis]|uniref:Calcineurin-like phosphoesterase family protein n=1 Tax=Helicobacter canis TaxID=29419 RepID=A0A377J4H6_9HELI|nr:metallophosphoesterase [Helicobacter canis]STO97205.1 calcineurin-like phosphoesterase family protein [Helicobacter canis]